MIRDVILDVNRKFIEEGKSSPRLFEDLAQLEHYIAESYGNRVLIELLQNADDANSVNAYLYYDGENLYFANDGKPFDENDIISISRSGSSSKDRKESIGYRGVGFKSTTFLTEDIIIHSNNEYFTFSNKRTKEALSRYGIQKYPTVRIPFLIDNVDIILKNVVNKLSEKFNTVFVFQHANIDILKDELKNLQNDIFIFLNNIKELKIIVDDVKKDIRISKENYYVYIQNNEEKNMWKIYKGGSKEIPFQIAFRVDNQIIVPCSSNESVLHVFLPTLDKLGFPFKINGHFSTDPSRKHVSMDDICKEILKKSAELVVEIIKEIFSGNPSDSGILQIITTNNSLSKFSMYFEENLYELIKKLPLIKTKNGNFICVTEIKKLPKFLSLEEFNSLTGSYNCFNSSVPAIQIDYILNEFLEKFSIKRFSSNDMISIFSIEAQKSSTNNAIIGKVLANIVNDSVQQKYDKSKIINLYLIGKEGKLLSFKNMDLCTEDFTEEFINSFNENVYKNALDCFDNFYGTKFSKLLKSTSVKKIPNNSESSSGNANSCNMDIYDFNGNKKIENDNNKIHTSEESIGMRISKWRSAEIQCAEIEKYFFGNVAKDVSKQNKGYDVESISNNGEMRYIEVKSLKSESDYFTLTNNEYTTAHMYGKEYILCLIINQSSKLKAIYIKDPISNLKMEKRVKQWEWYCDSYNGDEYVISF